MKKIYARKSGFAPQDLKTEKISAEQLRTSQLPINIGNKIFVGSEKKTPEELKKAVK